MFAYFEATNNLLISSNSNNNNNNNNSNISSSSPSSRIQCLSWMGKVNENKEWKCDRFLYYKEGWLATGNKNSIIGTTFTTCFSQNSYLTPTNYKTQTTTTSQSTAGVTNGTPTATATTTTTTTTNNANTPSNSTLNSQRTNFNLRGHKNDIKQVKWNEPYQKLATCDSKGIIYVWVKYEGRWSIELINDRSKTVADFSWSHDGRMIVICYDDGFTLVGSVNGQRYWSHLFELNSNTHICAVTWTPNDLYVLIGLSNSNLMIIDEHGTYLTQFCLSQSNDSIVQLCYNCPKFFMDEEFMKQIPTTSLLTNKPTNTINNNDYQLACSFKQNGIVHILQSYDDLDPIVIRTNLDNIKIDWSNCGYYLAVGGCDLNDNTLNYVYFYNKFGILLYKLQIPREGSTFTALTWGHNDERLFVSTESNVYVAIVYKRIASCALLAKLRVKSLIKDDKLIDNLCLPTRLKEEIKQTYSTTITSIYPKYDELRNFVCTSSPYNERLHCTMKRNEDNHDDHYTLYLEYLGNLVPLLKAKKSSKIKPDFVIYDPTYTVNNQIATKRNDFYKNETLRRSSSGYSSDSTADSVDCIQSESICGSPKLRYYHSSNTNGNSCGGSSRKARRRNNNNSMECKINNKHKLVEINSNIWGTKFKFNGINYLQSNIGSITYKTSLFHLQPRQMTIKIKDLTAAAAALTINNHLNNNNNNCTISTTISTINTYTQDINNNVKLNCGNSKTISSNYVNNIQQQCTINNNNNNRSSNNNNNNNTSSSTMSTNNSLIISNDYNYDDDENDDERENDNDDVLYDTDDDESINRIIASSLVVYPSNDDNTTNLNQPSTSNTVTSKSIKKLSNSNISTITTSPQPPTAQISYLSRPTSPANLIRPISPPAIQIREPIASPRVHKHVQQIGSNNNNTNHHHRQSSSVSLNSPSSLSINNDSLNVSITRSSTKQQQMSIISDINACGDDRELNKYLIINDNKQQQQQQQHHYQQYDQKQLDFQLSLNEQLKRKHLQSLISCLDPTTTNEPSNRVLLSNSSNSSNNQPKPINKNRVKSGSKSMKHHNQNKTNDVRQAQTKNEKLSLSDPTLSSIHLNNNMNNKVVTNNIKNLSQTQSQHSSIKSDNIVKLPNGNSSSNKVSLRSNSSKKRSKNRICSSDSLSRSDKPIEYVMHNKPPIWNEANQVYQLDFGGRVTQESAKNFQIEFNGKQVMQFGRIDNNAYTLDYEWPFTTVQAFSIALANITQRLK